MQTCTECNPVPTVTIENCAKYALMTTLVNDQGKQVDLHTTFVMDRMNYETMAFTKPLGGTEIHGPQTNTNSRQEALRFHADTLDTYERAGYTISE
jgi:hypothetical protein